MSYHRKHVVFVGGWAGPPQMFAVLALRMLAKADVTFLDPLTIRAESPRLTYVQAVGERIRGLPGLITLVGYSMGGAVLLQFLGELAGKTGGPEIERVILLSTTSCAVMPAAEITPEIEKTPWGLPISRYEQISGDLRTDRKQALREFYKGCFFPRSVPNPLIELLVFGANLYSGDELQRGLDFLATTDLRTSLAALSYPITILHGMRDAIIPVGSAHLLHKAFPTAEIKIIPQGGHILFPVVEGDLEIISLLH